MNLDKHVYFFGNFQADGNGTMKNLLGGKGANLAEMNRIQLPIPAGFTITTEVCNYHSIHGSDATISLLREQVFDGLQSVEKVMGATYGDSSNPLLLSVRSGARVSMPGMMDTVLNLGLNEKTVKGLIKKSNNPRFVWDSYRRLIQMYGNVVMGVSASSQHDKDPFEEAIAMLKAQKSIEFDTDLSVDDLISLVDEFKKIILKHSGESFPDDPLTQLWNSIMAVFRSWKGNRAVVYRNLNNIPHDWGTAVNVQAMVYGNMGNSSATGVAFTRDAATGQNGLNGEFLVNAQGEDVVAGIRTPLQITKKGAEDWAKLARIPEAKRKTDFPSLEELMPVNFKQMVEYTNLLEEHYRDMQDLEFTIQDGKLWILQTRDGKRTGRAMIRIAMEMLGEGMIDTKTALSRIDANKLNELLHPEFDKVALTSANQIAHGLPASPGAATGQVVFSADEAIAAKEKGKDSILVRIETSPEDVGGMDAARGILTARGGMTSHAAVVARGMGKCCVSGAESIKVNYAKKYFKVGDVTIKKGDWISLDGSTGNVYQGTIPTTHVEQDDYFDQLMTLAGKHKRMKVRANADTPEDSRVARNFGAEGIGLCRTEHMFFEGEKIVPMREMILADDEQGRRKALDKLLPIQREDFEGVLEAMAGFPVTVRLLDPPLHEFIPHDLAGQRKMADVMDVPVKAIQQKVVELGEFNPMLGHRGCRLGNTYPEITEMQTRAIIEAALNLQARGIDAQPEIMIPLAGSLDELKVQEQIVRDTIEQVFKEQNARIKCLVGTMIEIPRAALIADQMAQTAEFFSFGTNDLTQMTYGFSRDDIGKFLPTYLEKGILKHDPFEKLDQEGVGQLVQMACQKGRQTKPKLKLGICGEHGGEPSSIQFFHRTGLDYVSCSPFRVPIALVVAAQEALADSGE